MITGQSIKRWLFSISAAAAFLTTTYAQKEFIPTNIHGHMDMNMDLVRTVTDTLNDHFDSATATLYISPNGGFVGGNSGFGETARAQEFDVDTVNYTVEGFLYWFGYKAHQSLPSDSSSLNFKFWNNNYTATVGGLTRLIPYTIIDSTEWLITDLVADTNFLAGVNVWMLPAPVFVSANYSVGFSMENLHVKDTVSLIMSTDGDAPVSFMSWEKWNGAWNLILNTWGLDADYAIFPIVDIGSASVEGNEFVQGLKFNLYPNPASDWMNVEMEVEAEGDYQCTIHDLSGRLIQTRNLGYLTTGRVSTSLDIFELPAGNYVFTLTNGKKGLSKKFIKN